MAPPSGQAARSKVFFALPCLLMNLVDTRYLLLLFRGSRLRVLRPSPFGHGGVPCPRAPSDRPRVAARKKPLFKCCIIEVCFPSSSSFSPLIGRLFRFVTLLPSFFSSARGSSRGFNSRHLLLHSFRDFFSLPEGSKIELPPFLHSGNCM